MDGLETIHIFTDTCGTESSENIKMKDELISINILTVLHKNRFTLDELNRYFLFNLH